MNKAIVDLFTKASTNTAEQQGLILKFKKIFQKSNPDRFRKVFLQCCLALTKYDYKKSNNQIEQSLKFVSAFCGNCYNSEEVDEVDQFVVDILDNLLQGHNSSQTNFRYYICKMITLIMEQIEANLRDDICDRIEEGKFKRLNVRKVLVQKTAINAAMRSDAYLRYSAQELRVFEIEQRQFLVIHIPYDDHEPSRSILE